MEIQVMAFNRFLNNRLLGYANLSLQRLLDENHIQLAVSLLDVNGRPLKVREQIRYMWCGRHRRLKFEKKVQFRADTKALCLKG